MNSQAIKITLILITAFILIYILNLFFIEKTNIYHLGKKSSIDIQKSQITTSRLLNLELSSISYFSEEFPNNKEFTEEFISPPGFFSNLFLDQSNNDYLFETIQNTIQEAKNTYSDEGLAVIEPFLLHSRARVRAEAIDAIIQMDLPASGKTLRHAAQKATSQSERNLLLEAANFCDLPSVSVEKLKNLQ